MKTSDEYNLAVISPKLAEEWHYEKNKGLEPKNVSPYSKEKVWWKCSEGHEWIAPVKRRSCGIGCPFCAGKKPTVGVNDLATENPELANEWHPYRNGTLRPIDVKLHSNLKVWWQCEHGHEWRAYINNRSHGIGCPYCSGKIALEGENDLLTKNPELAKEWNSEKNGQLLPSQVTTKSGKKVWWICFKGHEWRAIVGDRSKRGCPYCAGRYPISGETDLATINPELSREWHPTNNQQLSPNQVTPFSAKKVWWLCSEGHEWIARVQCRSRGTKCPFCAGKQPLNGKTDLNTLNSQLAKEWHPFKNYGLFPENVSAHSHNKVWWICEYGHEWIANIDNRSKGNGCPYCAGNIPVKGINDLATKNPQLARQWHPTKNKGLSADQVMPNSHKKVWWICDEGHEWKAEIKSRNMGTQCPYDIGMKPAQSKQI